MLKLGLVGNNIQHSISPQIHRILSRYSGVPCTYDLLDVATFPGHGAIKEFNGLNVTIPFKEEAFRSVELHDSSAKKTGAVNTIMVGDQIEGFNTDYLSTRFLLESGDQRMSDALLIGSGGVARAAVGALLDLGVSRITVAARSKDRLAEMSRFFGISISPFDRNNDSHFDIVINAVPPDGFPFLGSVIRNLSFDSYIDYVYHAESPLILKARKMGIRGIEGRKILILQAIFSHEIWTEANLSFLYGLEVFQNVI
ncbi:MAG: NAD(P)-binding domain-containing protein [Thermoplasmataceae archaeon]